MSNNSGPKASIRRLINTAIHSQMLYAAPIILPAIRHKSVTTQLVKPQRISALRVISGYRTISTSASLVLAGIPPIDLLILERAEIWQQLTNCPAMRHDISICNLVKKEARNRLIDKWQERWQSDNSGRWTFRLIPNLKTWLERKHGEMNYYLTQVMTGHGNFNSYLHRFKITEITSCDDCGSPDDNAEHMFFHCAKWENLRKSLYEAINIVLTPENIIQEMLLSENTWNLTQNFIYRVMKYRNNREPDTEPLSSPEDGGVGSLQ